MWTIKKRKMIRIKVSEQDKIFAKSQIDRFKRIEQGKWRYSGVEAWRGIVCEMLTGKWLESNFPVQKKAKGLDDSGIVDDCDMVINGKKVEIKSATKSYFKYIMPKIHDVLDKPKDVYIGAKYIENVEPNEVEIIGFITRDNILKYPIEKNKGAPYYKVPLTSLKQF